MEKKQEILSKIAYGSFYLAVIMEVMIVLIDKSALVNPIEGRLFQITFFLFLIKVCFTKYSLKEYAAMILFLLLGAVSYAITGRNEVIRFVMFIASCKGIDMRKCLKMVFIMTVIGCVTIMLLAMTGIYGTMSLTQDYGRGGIETRYTLGMGHPNSLQCMIWALTTLSLYLYGEKMKWYGYVSILAVNFFFFYLTDSKTSLISAVFIICYAGIICLIKYDLFRKICCIGGYALTMGCIALSVLIAVEAYRVYDFHWYWKWSEYTEIFLKLDNAFTGRIHSLVSTTRWEGTIQTWRLFSEPANNYYFDMGWIRLFYWYGIIPASIFIIIIFILMVFCMKQKKYMAFAMIVSFALYSLVEAHAISVYLARNYVLFLMGAYAFRAMHLDSEKECYWWQIIKQITESR